MSRFPLLLALLAGCPGEKDDTGTQGTDLVPREFSDCDPLSYDHCMLPFPSSYYEREDATTASGIRIHLGPTTLPPDRLGNQPDPWAWNELDGFSPMAPILAHFPDMTLEGVVGHDNIDASTADGATIVILDADTGERMPYFAELDVSGEYVAGKNLLMIRPAVPLRYEAHYIVAVRGLVDPSGAPIAASEGFATLRDGTAADTWDIEGRRDVYEDIFTKLEADGWSRAETQLAWDFHVASVEGITGRYTHIRDEGLAQLPAGGPTYTITSVDDDWDVDIYRRIQGTFTAPNYMDADEAGSLLTRDENGMPFQNGETEVPFTVLIPRTFFENPRPLPMVQYGHGLLGHHSEVEGGYLKEMANRYGFVLFATDWKGMAEDDYDAIVLMLALGLDRFAIIPERSQQGYFEFAAAVRMMKGDLGMDAAATVEVVDEGGATTTVSAFDPSTVYYYGNSQGGIYGGGYMTLQPEITRCVLGVPGMPYSLLLSRSVDFDPFFILFQAEYPDQRDITVWMTLMQMLWDSADPGGTARLMNEDPLDGVAHEVLMQAALGDYQVTTLGAHNMARAYGADMIAPVVRDVWGVETQAEPFVGNGYVEFDFGNPEPFENVPPEDLDDDPHSGPRKSFEGQEQLWHFLTTGEVKNFCDGVCVFE